MCVCIHVYIYIWLWKLSLGPKSSSRYNCFYLYFICKSKFSYLPFVQRKSALCWKAVHSSLLKRHFKKHLLVLELYWYRWVTEEFKLPNNIWYNFSYLQVKYLHTLLVLSAIKHLNNESNPTTNSKSK